MTDTAAAAPTRAPDWAGLLLAMAGSIAFSGKAIIVKLAYRHATDAVTVIMLRMLFALPLFLVLAWWAGRGKPALTRRDAAAVLGLGFSGYYLASFLDFAGLAYVTASFERIVLYTNPTIVALLGWIAFGRRLSSGQLLAMALSYAGVLVVFGHELALDAQQDVPLGAALVLGSALSYAVYLLYSGEVVRRLGSLRLTGLASSVACVLCIAQYALLKPAGEWTAIPAPVLGLSVLNAIACTFAPVLMVMMAIERIGPTATAQAGMIGPLSTIAMGVLLLGEPFTGWMVLGTALVMAGVWLFANPR